MLRSILSLSIMGLAGLLVSAVLLPTQTREVAQSVLSTAKEFTMLVPVSGTSTGKEEEMESGVKNQTPFTPIETTAKTIIDAIAPNKNKDAVANSTAMTAANVIDATNKERIKVGLPPLSTNEKLAASAKIKTDDMMKQQYFEHVSPNGVAVSDLGVVVGYDYVVMGENLALGNFTGPADLMKAWMNSPGHRANIVSENYMEIGIYVAEGQYQGRKVWFAVQHFGTARGACPVVSQDLKDKIDLLNASLKSKEQTIIKLRAQLEAMDPESSEYQEKAVSFNKLVAEYNTELAISQSSITQHNRQVVAFNACLSKYQKGE